MSLKYEPASVPQHISVKCLNYAELAGLIEFGESDQSSDLLFSSLLLSSLELSDTKVYEP